MIFVLSVAVLILIGCGILKDEDMVEASIPGTYIRFSKHEYGTEYDTLVITLQNEVAKEYRILRKWKYERVIDNTPMETEYKRSVTSGIYNTEHKLLQEISGDLYSFDVKGKLLFNGPIQYQKL